MTTMIGVARWATHRCESVGQSRVSMRRIYVAVHDTSGVVDGMTWSAPLLSPPCVQ